MACKLIWSPAARDDLHDIVRFIARDNPERAESFGYELMMRTDILCMSIPRWVALFPNIGIPESAKLSIDRIVSSIASIRSDNW
jgi:hypothetical protein